MKRIRILLVDDHRMVREGLRALLSSQADLQIVGEAAEGEEAIRLATELVPDIIVLDISLPGLDGITLLPTLQSILTTTKIIVLSMHDDALTVERALRAGVHGYVLKGLGSESLCAAVRAVDSGQVFLSPGISDYVLQGFLGEATSGLEQLSPREREVLRLVAEGHTSREIAHKLGLSPKTVENHRANLSEKLDVKTTAGLVRYAMRAGLID